MRALHRFAVFVAACTVLLIAAGGMVTSTGSGLAVPDWPNTYGHFMFSFPLDRMVGGILYEHGHRMIASIVGMLTIVLAAWTWRVDPRTRVRRLALVALAVVVLQGLLGGLTVLFLLPAPISIGHAGLAQLFFCLTVSLALFTSSDWRHPRVPLSSDRGLAGLTLGTTVLIYIQILLGATIRHRHAGLAIPDFPLAFGRVIPPFWSVDVAVHFSHRIGALLVAVAAVAICAHVWRRHRRDPRLVRPAMVLLALVALQGTLGAFVVLSRLQPIVNTAHVVNGALVLAASLVLTLRSRRMAVSAWLDRSTPRASMQPTPIEARS